MGLERDNYSSVSREPPRLDGSGARSAVATGPAKPERDWKRSVLIGGLGTLSWVATYAGMLELIEANMGDLPLVHKLIIGFSVAMLMIMIIWLLDQLFKPHPFVAKALYATGYVFLTVISVGFGFGFYWKVLESKGEASRSAESAVGSVQSSLHAASTRLEQLQATLIQLTQVSTEKAELERTKGLSCPNSKPGDGPRRKMREEDAQRFQFSSEFVKGRVASVRSELSTLNDDMIRIVSDDPATIDPKTGTRNEFMRSLSRKLDLTVTGFNAFRTDPQLKQMRADLADRAERTAFSDNRGGTFACPDPQLQTALRGVVKAIDQLPALEKPQIAAVEGSEATIEAFRRLTTTFYGLLSFKLPPSAEDMRDLQKKAVQSVENGQPEARGFSTEQGGLSKRDYVPLAVALFVDLCLFLVSMVQAPRHRLSGLLPKMQNAENGPVIEILSRFNDIHRDQQVRASFEIFRHVVFDMNGDYYVAVPLDAPPALEPAEREELRVEAQLLANLFASFEKEKIFKRTLLPTTGSIQKRLKRQGSKFAASEAFRVYKFTDGAWSDIILGAVMGAAKRAENDKRAFPSAHLRPRPLESDMAAVKSAPVASLAAPAAPRPAPVAGPSPVPAPQPSATIAQQSRPAMAPVIAPVPRTAPPQPFAPAAAMPPRPKPRVTAPPRPYRMPSLHAATPTAPDAGHLARFGPYATAYRPQEEPLIGTVPPEHARGAHSPAAPAQPYAPVESSTADLPPHTDAVVVPLDRDGRTEPAAAKLEPVDVAPPMVGVTLARETATFSIPAHATPASLREAISRVSSPPPLPSAAPPTPAPGALETRAEAPARLELVPLHELEEEPVSDIKVEPLTERDLAIINRMAPPAG